MIEVRAEPISRHADHLGEVVSVIPDVLASNVGQKLLIAVTVAIKNESDFLLLLSSAKSLGGEEDSQLEGHIEAWKLILTIKLRARKIVDTEPAVSNDLKKTFESDSARIISFQSTTRPKPAVHHRIDNRIEDIAVFVVERAIDEHCGLVADIAHHRLLRLLFCPTLLPREPLFS